jgi:hypothetical protein
MRELIKSRAELDLYHNQFMAKSKAAGIYRFTSQEDPVTHKNCFEMFARNGSGEYSAKKSFDPWALTHADYPYDELATMMETLADELLNKLKDGLLPCPFCGSKATISQIFDDGDYRVLCVNSWSCGAKICQFNRDEAILGWNRRTPQDECQGD